MNVGPSVDERAAGKGEEGEEERGGREAIESPNTICTRRRMPPPMSPKARLRPVRMMLTTAETLATGPSIGSRMRCRGASHGIQEPAAWAEVVATNAAI